MRGATARRRGRWSVGAGAAVAALLATAGCGAGDDGAAPAPTGDTGSEATATDGGGTGPAVEIDACALLTEAEAGEVLGGTVIGSGPTSGVGASVCAWEIEGDWSITVSVGSPGTAPGGTFDPATVNGLGTEEPVASPEGAYYVGLGTVAFAADDRVNTVTVVTESAGGADRAAAEALAPVVYARLLDLG